MQIVSKDKLPGSIIKYVIEENVDIVAKNRGNVIEKLSKTAQIDGFRKGAKIPENVIVSKFGADYINGLVVESAIDEMYKELLRSEGIIPTATGEITEVISQNPLKISVEIETFPEIEVDEKYKNVKIKGTKASVSEEEIDSEISQILQRLAHFHDGEEGYKAKSGDKVRINTAGYDLEGKLLEGTEMKNYDLILGANVLVPGFEDQLIGIKSGETRKIDITFPEDYFNDEFKSKKTKFDVEALKVERVHAPTLDEKLIEDLTGKKLDEKGFREFIKNEILSRKESDNRVKEEKEILGKLLEFFKMDLGKNMLKTYESRVLAEIRENFINAGGRFEDYLSSLGMSEEDYKRDFVDETARQRLSGELILGKIVEIEKLEVTDEDFQKEVEKIVDRFTSEETKEKVRNVYKPGRDGYQNLKARLGFKKALEQFIEY